MVTRFDGDLFTVDALDKTFFKWNGLPSVEFAENVIAPFRAGLMTVGDKDATLWQTGERGDPAGTRGTPNFASLNPANAADALIIANHEYRKLKLFGVLCNYTDSRSEAYKMFMRDYNSDGCAVWEFIKSYGPLPIPQRYVRAREENWKQLTYDKLKLPYSVAGYFRYLDVIKYHARKLNIDCAKQKEKFITGLPEFMRSAQTNMRQSSHVYPANYGGIPRFVTAPFAATAHPNAGEQDIDALARAYFIDFFENASSMQGVTSDGIVNMATWHGVDAVDFVNAIQASKVMADTICFHCGGKGHGETVIGFLPNGEPLVCPSKQLGHPPIKERSARNVMNTEIDETKTDYTMELNTTLVAMTEQLRAVQEQINALKSGFRHKRQPRTQTPPPTQRTLVAEQSSSESDGVSAGSEMDDMSSIASMANSLKSSKQPKYQRFRHRPKE